MFELMSIEREYCRVFKALLNVLKIERRIIGAWIARLQGLSVIGYSPVSVCADLEKTGNLFNANREPLELEQGIGFDLTGK